MRITPTTLTISQLFNNQSEQFFIPAYQRRYAWQWKQAKELFDDVNNLEDADSHLLGNIVCLTTAHTAGINSLEVVDGQQRITTLSLLLKAFHRKFLEIGDIDECNRIEGLLDARGADRNTQNKVLLGELDDPDYERVLKQTDLESIKNENLLKNYNYFKNWLKDLKNDDLYALHYKFMNSVSVIRLDVFNAKDAYKLFETINNRGLKLNPTDIIKNFLLGHASYFDQNTLDKVKDNWKQLIIALDQISTDDFFRQLMSGFLRRKITFTYLTDEFKKYYINCVKDVEKLPEYKIYKKIELKDEDELQEELGDEVNNTENNNGEDEDSSEEKSDLLTVIEFSKLLKDYALVYAKIRNRTCEDNKINAAIYNLQRIKSMPSYIYLLPLFFDEDNGDKEKLQILKMIAVFMLRRHICEYRTGELDDIFSKLVNSLDEEDFVEEAKIQLIKDIPGDTEFKLKFKKATYKNNFNRAKYVLEQYEYDNIGNTGELSINSGMDVHLEHIIPQTITTKKSIREFGDWELYLGENAALILPEYINRIGNFTLLGQKLNIDASNNPFEDKLVEYKKSAFKLTQEIVNKYSEFKFEQVEERSSEFAEQAPKMWKLS